MVHGGDRLFEDDDIVAFLVEGANPDGSLNDNSVITGIVVYDNASDYYYDNAKYTYSSTTGASVDVGRNTMGDRYLEFDASSLTSSDSGAPSLDEIALFGGIDIFAAMAESKKPFEVPTNEDIDYNGDGVISPGEQGDGIFSSDINLLTTICFCAGTLIETPKGPRRVETLMPGDMVNTLDQGPQPIRWIGGMRCKGEAGNAPVQIKSQALGNVRDLWVSQNHRMMVSGAWAELLFGEDQVLVAAKHLVNDDTIRIIAREEVIYYHFLFDDHQIVFAEGAPSESLYPGPQGLNAISEVERDEILELFPELGNADHDRPTSRQALRAYEAEALLMSA
ncbi:Hint domain-containing protein [Rhodalgimonas zhirmunskyi]|uniref:Hint domain-containing protein n=1 Tax=Rhodalgimonas zhirmunskyi TaxID=2964767 RepID=A0AAJ1U5H2_9RHOB|nr:Hint domain-containing protein [Rhodoalgimonas zhirmunskyi]MDQ2093500.1 Hint domain-containing protein [Rhodoalgimonas zhirmunskyi]